MICVRKFGDRWGYECGLHYSEPRMGLGRWNHERALNAAFTHWDLQHSRLIGNVCPRCANGLPNCAQYRPDGKRWTHEETCAKYDWAENVCDKCEREMAEGDAA